MVLILSTQYDYSTSQVIKWLNFLEKPFIRINDGEAVSIEKLTDDDLIFSFKNERFCLSEISSIWYRRGDINIHTIPLNAENRSTVLEGYNSMEGSKITEYIHNLFREKKNINNFNHSEVNKLDVLKYCKANGLNNSNFLITQSKKELLDFLKYNKEVISKPVNTAYIVKSKESIFSTYTYLVGEEDTDKLSETFTPTFFQSHLDKKYEIRTFFLDGEFYSMAIFSQRNSSTKTDFRQYDWEHPNRISPYSLSVRYKNKLSAMLNHFNINCASLDTIITKNGDHFMIDLNPIGQFGMTSKPCNYNIEKLIAEYL